MPSHLTQPLSHPATALSLPLPSPFCHSEQSEESAVRLNPSPIPKGNPYRQTEPLSSPTPLFLAQDTFSSLGAKPTCPGLPWRDLQFYGSFLEMCFRRSGKSDFVLFRKIRMAKPHSIV
jgi:hypothetical protein